MFEIHNIWPPKTLYKKIDTLDKSNLFVLTETKYSCFSLEQIGSYIPKDNPIIKKTIETKDSYKWWNEY